MSLLKFLFIILIVSCASNFNSRLRYNKTSDKVYKKIDPLLNTGVFISYGQSNSENCGEIGYYVVNEVFQFFNDSTFIKLKPTIVYLLFSTLLFLGLILNKNFLKIYLSNLIKLNDTGWNILSKRWGIFFLLMAILNEIIWRNFSTDFWVSFKVFGFLPITIIFTILQKDLIQKYQIK